jgi:hypothetical protein
VVFNIFEIFKNFTKKMMQLILILLGLVFSNGNITNNNNNQDPVMLQNSGGGVGLNPGTRTGDDGDTSGNTGQKPPFTNPSTNP